MIRSGRVFAVVLAFACMTGCAAPRPGNESDQGVPAIVWRVVDETSRSVKMVGMDHLMAVAENPGDAVIIDVREPDEFAQGHVKNAANIPRGILEFRGWQEIGFPRKGFTQRTIYVCSDRGARAVLAAKTLQDLGFKNVFAVALTPGGSEGMVPSF